MSAEPITKSIANDLDVSPTMSLPKCDVCGKQVGVSQGVLAVDHIKVEESQSSIEEWRKRVADRSVRTVSDILNDPAPAPAKWFWGHIDCQPVGRCYEIAADRVDTPLKLLDWTRHLMLKEWLQYTDWSSQLDRFVGPRELP